MPPTLSKLPTRILAERSREHSKPLGQSASRGPACNASRRPWDDRGPYNVVASRRSVASLGSLGVNLARDGYQARNGDPTAGPSYDWPISFLARSMIERNSILPRCASGILDVTSTASSWSLASIRTKPSSCSLVSARDRRSRRPVRPAPSRWSPSERTGGHLGMRFGVLKNLLGPGAPELRQISAHKHDAFGVIHSAAVIEHVFAGAAVLGDENCLRHPECPHELRHPSAPDSHSATRVAYYPWSSTAFPLPSVSAQAFATAEFGSAFPGIVAQPPFSTNLLWSHK
jgi:hypothetical protein